MSNRYGQNASDYNAVLNASVQTTAALIGGVVTATATLTPHGETWNVSRVFVSASTRTTEAVATTYRGTVAQSNFIENTYAGSSGDSTDTPLLLRDGENLIVQWTGGDIGATYTATVSGWRTTPMGGFQAQAV